MLDVLVSRSAEQTEQDEDGAFIARHNPHPHPQGLLWFPNVCASPEMDETQTDKPAGWNFPNQPTTVCTNLKSATKVDVTQAGRRQTPSPDTFSYVWC